MTTADPIPGPSTTTSNAGAGGGVSTVERPQWWISRDSTQARPQVDRVSCSLKNQPEAMGTATLLQLLLK